MSDLRGHELFFASEDEIELVTGTKIALMYCPGTEDRFAGSVKQNLISVGTNQPEGSKWAVHREGVLDVLYFIRVGGQWEMMLSDWGM
jgi:hypothetical protein